jgi:uncharacterized protein YhbP (UPF0306 family)
MDNDQVEQTIRQYITQVVHMSLGTSVDNKPWVCEVHFAYDNSLNLYWISEVGRRHSQEIEQNPNVAGNIVTQHFLNQKIRGVYFEGQAHKLEGVTPEHPSYLAYKSRFGEPPHLKLINEEDGPRMYQLIVSDWYLFDTYSGPGQKYRLEAGTL